MELNVGDKAPSFTLLSTDDHTVNIGDYINKNIVILYFYPKDDTPGCTTEAKDFAELYDEFVKAGAIIFGISKDHITSHQKFKEKYNLPFELVADPEKIACDAYSVVKDKNMYGKMVKAIERSTFVIDRSGAIAKIWRKVKVEGHAKEVLEFVQTL